MPRQFCKFAKFHMHFTGWRKFFLTGLLFLVSITILSAKVNTAKFGVLIADTNNSSTHIKKAFDSVLAVHPYLNQKTVIVEVLKFRTVNEKTADFYFLMLLVLFLGCIRLIDPKYIHTLWLAITNSGLTPRQMKDKLQSNSFLNLLMNIFFTISSAAFVFYLVKTYVPQRSGSMPSSILVVMLIFGMIVIYLGKYAVIKFSGWAFRLEGITDFYLFNVFLINKIISILLLPFILLLAFADPAVAQPALFISFILIISLFVNRYMRSWQVFGSFFQYSKFHFFMYLCASELLPLAVLMKLLVRGLLS
jgi:hypothetical protein